MFPSSLTSLTMDFQGVFGVLSTRDGFAPTFFGSCNRLLHLHLADMNTHAEIDLKHFPATLLTLVVKAHPLRHLASYQYDDLPYLPPDLEKLHINVLPSWGKASKPTIELGANIPGNLASLTDLSIWINHPGSLTTDLIGAHLKRLDVYTTNALTRHGDHKNVFETGNIAECYPVLESLHCNQPVLWSAARIQTLPPSLTELAIASAWSQLIKTGMLEERNVIAERGAKIRWIANYEREIPMSCDTLQLFPRLEYLSMRILVKDAGYLGPELLPRSLTQVSVEKLSVGQLQLLPPSLTSLKTTEITADTEEKQLLSMLPPDSVLKGLSSLSTNSYIPIELALNLPSSLESLTFREGSCASLSAIARRSNQGHFPRLTYLSITTPFTYEVPMPIHPQFGEPWELSLAVVPRTLETLIVAGYVQLSKNEESSLQHLSSLTHLEILDKALPAELFLQLPGGLKVLRFNLSIAIDLGDPKLCLAFWNLRTKLAGLKELELVDSSKFVTPSVSRLRKTPPLSFREFCALPWPMLKFYLKSMARIRFKQHTTLWEDAYIFGILCLPRSLSKLTIPSSVHLWENLVSVSATPELRTVVMATIKYHLPLFALPYINTGLHPQREALVRAMPPHISKLSIGRDCANVHPFVNTTGMEADEVYKADRATSEIMEPCFHAVNLVSWLAFYCFVPRATLQVPFLKVYMWNSIVGSGLTLGITLWRLYKKGLLASHRLSAVKVPIRRSLTLLAFFSPLIALLPWIAAPSEPGWSYTRMALLSAYVVVTSARNFLVLAVRHAVRFN